MGAGASSHSLIGSTIGNYRVVSKLGEGGMGAVYLAEHPLIGKKVALKVLHPELASKEEVVTRFFHEARAVNEIGHPNIVDVIDYGVLPREGHGPGLVYFIMELLGGESLGALLAREAPLDPGRAVAIAQQIADALGASHQKGVIHRDLKPDNVFLVERGRQKDFVKVLDFGIAKLTAGDRADLGRTRSGVVMGTPTYMSPEQCESRRDVDRRADVYALGVILYEMITGEVPFTGEGYGEVILQHITRKPRPPSEIRGNIPPAIEAIVLKAMEKKRDDRFASMEEFADALREPERFFHQEGASLLRRHERAVTMPGRQRSVDATASTLVPPPTTLSRSAAELGVPARSRVPVIAASAMVVLAGLLGGALLLLRHEPEPAEVRPVKVPAAPPPLATYDAPVAAAPAPPPVVEKIPVVPELITVSISSRPPGAVVLVGGEERGTTPMKLQLARQDAEVEINLKLDGYHSKAKRVRLDRDAELYLSLDKRSRRDRMEPVGEPETPASEPKEPKEEPPKEPKPGDDDVLPPTFGQ